jgi:hypothetical protein
MAERGRGLGCSRSGGVTAREQGRVAGTAILEHYTPCTSVGSGGAQTSWFARRVATCAVQITDLRLRIRRLRSATRCATAARGPGVVGACSVPSKVGCMPCASGCARVCRSVGSCFVAHADPHARPGLGHPILPLHRAVDRAHAHMCPPPPSSPPTLVHTPTDPARRVLA